MAGDTRPPDGMMPDNIKLLTNFKLWQERSAEGPSWLIIRGIKSTATSMR